MNKFKSVPLTVWLAATILVIFVVVGAFMIPSVVIPLVLFAAVFGSLFRLMIFFIHKQ